MEDHRHGPDGSVITIEPSAEAAAVETAEVETDAVVKVAEIEADRDITLAKLAVKAEETEQVTEIEALKAEMKGMREILNRLVPPAPEPEAEPEPEVIPMPIEADEPDMAPPESEEHHSAPAKRKLGLGMW